jgi:hypothetical protein
MRPILGSTAAALALAFSSGPVDACRTHARLEITDVKYADVIVIGRISHYRIVRDVEFRRKMLADPNLSPAMRGIYEGRNGLLSDYAAFDIQVDQVLFGSAPATLSVTWDNSTFGEPETMAAGPFLIALRQPNSKMPPLRGPSATILPSREPASLTVLQAPCSSPFIFESTGEEARAIRLLLAAGTR